MLIEERRRTAHAHRRARQSHRRARAPVFANHGMLDLSQPFARSILLAIDEFADGVERRRGEMARLRFVSEIVGGELTDKISECLRDFLGVLISIARILPFRSRK